MSKENEARVSVEDARANTAESLFGDTVAAPSTEPSKVQEVSAESDPRTSKVRTMGTRNRLR